MEDMMKQLADALAAQGVPADPRTVDCIGLALDLEARSKVVESQTTERAMLAAAHGLRLLAATPAPARAQQADTERLDYLQKTGSTVSLTPDQKGPGKAMGFQFCVGGLWKLTSPDLRVAIDAARGIGASSEKEE